MVNLGALFGEESAFRQLLIWGVGQQVLNAMLGPGLNELTQLVNEVAPTTILTPDILADLVVRGYLHEGQAVGTAAKSGVSAEDLHLMILNTAQPPDPTQLIEAYRRRYIPWDAGAPDGVGVLQGIRESHLGDKWAPMIQALGEVPIGIADAVDAVVESQITRAQGETIAYQNGISAASFDILYNTRGNPPSPTELMELVRRGHIPEAGLGPNATSFEQGIAEGATKNKWTRPLSQLIEVIPPARTVTAMQRDGSLTAAQAAQIYRQLGYSETISAAFVHEASRGKTQAARHLAKADILALYTDGVIDRKQAVDYLIADGYEPHEADQEVVIAEMRAEIAAQKQAVTHVRTLYLGRKMSAHDASRVLDQLHVAPAARDKLLATWQAERAGAIRTLTVAEIADAMVYGVFSQEEATLELIAEGYTPIDAWAVLSIKNKGPLPGKPGGEPSPADRVP